MYIVIVEQMHKGYSFAEGVSFKFKDLDEAITFVQDYADNLISSCKDRMTITMAGDPMEDVELKDD